ncbi:MAG: hypothetical protein KGL39_45490 [Patescibacteria group bacterium]|nr:hypothetical protein [Patescibacteria group bacterium]
MREVRSVKGEVRGLAAPGPDSSNVFEVVRRGELVSFRTLTWPRFRIVLSRKLALNLGLWLVAMADPKRKEFDRRWEEINRRAM